MPLRRLCSRSLLRLLACSSSSSGLGAAAHETAAAAAQISAAHQSSWSSWARNSSSWSQIPHPIPQPQLPCLSIPQHDIEQGLPEVTVWLREDTGTNFCSKLRRRGATPCQLSSLPGNQTVSLTLDSKDAARLVRLYGRNGIQAQLLQLNIYQQRPPQAPAAADAESEAAGPGSSSSSSSSSQQGDASSSSSPSPAEQQQQQLPQPLASVRVLTKLVHMHSVTQEVENFNFLYCPRDRLVKVKVPVKLWNADVSPGVKAGGWLHVVNRTVPVLARGWAVKPYFELDMKLMQARDVVRFRDVAMPEGCQLHATDPMQPVVRCAIRVGGE